MSILGAAARSADGMDLLQPRCEWCGEPDPILVERLARRGERTMPAPPLRSPILCPNCRQLLREMVESFRLALEVGLTGPAPPVDAPSSHQPAHPRDGAGAAPGEPARPQ